MTDRKKLGVAPSPATLLEQGQKSLHDLEQAIGGKTSPATPRPAQTSWHDRLPNDRDYTAEGFTREKIARNRGSDVLFWGRLLGEYSTKRDGRQTKWTEIRLWETPSGQWVAESAGCSDEPGHVDILDAIVIRGPIVLLDRQTMQDFEERTPPLISMEKQAMAFWQQSSPAKALAKRLGWDLTEVVD